MPNFSKEQILDSYMFRHACKVFDPSKKISDEDFRFILETGRLSPSSYGFEPWKFVVLQDPAIRERLKAVSWGAQGQLPTASHYVIIMARTLESMQPGSEYLTNLMKETHQMPEEIVQMISNFYSEFIEINLGNDPRLVLEWTTRQTYIAMGNMMTAAAQIGIDSCPIEGFTRDKVQEILREEGILSGNDFDLACMVAFGYRADDPKRPKSRQPLDNIVEWR